MSSEPIVFVECSRPGCQFRFPVEANNRRGKTCPKCGAETIPQAEAGFAGRQMTLQVANHPLPKSPPAAALLDNLRSTFNVGAIFRTADGAGFDRLHLCGITPTPENPKVGKTALGSENAIPWDYSNNSVLAVRQLKQAGACLWALEDTPQAISLYDALSFRSSQPLVLVVGNELAGVDPGVLELCDLHTWIPMRGMKESLNVAIAFSIAAYLIRSPEK